MRIVRFEAENLKRLKAVQITPAGAVVQITGPNGQGKSSVLDAIYWALAGQRVVDAQPVRQGEQKAHVRLDLGELVITRRFTAAGGTSLTVESAAGAQYRSPQSMLDALLGSLTFDPLAFTRMKPAEQRAELAKLAGLDTVLTDLTRENAKDAEERTGVNRQLKALEARLAAMGDVAPAAPVDVADVLQQIDAAEAANRERDVRASRRQQAEDQWRTLVQSAQDAREEAGRLLARAAREEATAAELREKLDTAAPLPAPIDVAPLRQQLVDAQSLNAAAERYRQREALAAEVAEVRAVSVALTEAISVREASKAHAVRAAAFPIPGLGLTDDGVTLNDLPFEQASSAEQLRASVAIAMAANPKLRVLRVKDGSLLDERSLALLEEMAEAADYQVWVERVQIDSPVGIVMEDGQVAAIDGVPVGAEAVAA